MVLPRGLRTAAASVAALTAAVIAHPALASPLAQESGGNDRSQVMFITLAAVVGALVLCGIGYFYRRAAGIDKPPPVTILEPGQRITGD